MPCIGTSTILAQHGTPESPHYWLELSTEERTCAQLGRRFAHDKLRLRSSTDGPTEIGGLILDPGYRRHPEKCGHALSIGRCAFMAARPDRVALWAFLLGVILMIVAALSAPEADAAVRLLGA